MPSVVFEANADFLAKIIAMASKEASINSEPLVISTDCFDERYENDLIALERGELELRPLNELKEKIKSW